MLTNYGLSTKLLSWKLRMDRVRALCLLTFAVFLLPISSVRAQSCVPPASGLVSWWPGEGNGNDVLGINNGLLIGGAAFAPGEVGQAFGLANGAYVQVLDSDALHMRTGLTLEAWVRPSDLSVAFGKLVTKDLFGFCVSPYFTYSLELDQSGSRPAFSVAHSPMAGDSSYVVASEAIRTGQWYHLAGTFDGSYIRIYINGMLKGEAPANRPTLVASIEPLVIGRSRACGQGVAGLYDEVSIYNRALSAAEIAAIFSAGAAGKCNGTSAPRCPSGLQISNGVPDFDEGTSQSVNLTLSGSDLSGSQITWSLAGPTANPNLGTGPALSTVLRGLSPGRYTLTATVTRSGCAAVSVSVGFTVNPPFQVVLSGAPVGAICLGTGITLTANVSPAAGTADSFNWTRDGLPFGGHTATLTDTPDLGSHSYSVTAVRSGRVSDPAAPVIINVFDFNVSITADQTVLRGHAAAYTAIVALTPGSAGAPSGVSLAVTGLPAGVSTPDLPAILTIGGRATFTLKTTDVVTPLGDRDFTVTGRAGGGDRAARARLHVYDFTVDIGPAGPAVLRGCPVSLNVRVVLTPGSSTFGLPPITLGVDPTGAPFKGVATRFTVNGATPPFLSTLTLISSEASSLGTVPFKVTGTDARTPAGGSRSSKVSSLRLYDLDLSIAPHPLILAQNQPGSYTVTLKALGASPSSPIELSLEGLPDGITGVFSPASVMATADGASAALVILPTVPADSLPVGTFALTITGTDGPGCRRAGSAVLTVVPALLHAEVRASGDGGDDEGRRDQHEEGEDDKHKDEDDGDRDDGCPAISHGFDVLFKRSHAAGLKLRATRPHGFTYNMAVTNTESAPAQVSLILDLPPNPAADSSLRPDGSSAFALLGTRPVRVFNGDPCADQTRNITPHGITIHTVEKGAVLQPLHRRLTPVVPQDSIIVPTLSIPAGDTIWVQVRLRYALIGSAGWPADSPVTFVRNYPFKARVTFDKHPLTHPWVTHLTGAGKKVTGVGGNALDVNGAGRGGLNVVVEGAGATCAQPDTVTEPASGFYFLPLEAEASSTITLYDENCDRLIQQSFDPIEAGQLVLIDFLDLIPRPPSAPR